MEVTVKYKVVENDSSWMSSRDLENESHKINILNKTDLVNFLKSLDYVTIHKDIYSELESDESFIVNLELDKTYAERHDDQWVSTDYTLIVKAVK